MSLLVALPTDAEITAVGAKDAGQYIMMLRGSEIEMAEFIKTRKRAWNQEPSQQVGRCIDHLLNIFTTMVELNTKGETDSIVSRSEADQFARLAKRQHSLHSNLEEGAFSAALKFASEQLLEALSKVPIFGGLSQDQLELLRGTHRPDPSGPSARPHIDSLT